MFGDVKRIVCAVGAMQGGKTATFPTASPFAPRLALATFSGTLGLVPLLLQLPHSSSGGGDGGVRGQGGHTGGDLLGPEAPSDEFEVDRLASVSEHLHRLLIGVSLDVNPVDLQGANV